MRKDFVRSVAGILCGASLVTAQDITVYSHRHYPSDQEVFDQFTEQTGVEVKVVKAKADELIERLKAEGDNTPADVFMTADAGRLERAKTAGLLQSIESEVLDDQIPDHLKDPDQSWFGLTKRARIIAYAKDRVDPSELSTYEDLANETWKGRILVRSSSNIYNQSLLASIIAAHDMETAVEWARAVRSNMARAPQGSDRDQMRAVAAGLGDVAIVNTYYLGLLHNSPNPKDRTVAEAIGIFFPNQEGRGTHINISGAGVTRGADNVDDAVRFLEFLASDEVQAHFPRTTYEYPVADGVSVSELVDSWGEFKADDLEVSTLGRLNEQAVKAFNLAGWE